MAQSATSDLPTYPRVFLASPLESLAGEWVPAVDAMDEAERIREEYGHEEVVIVDTDHLPWMGGHYPSIDKMQRLAELIEEHGEAFAEYVKRADSMMDVDELVDEFRSEYRGQWDSLEEYAWQEAEDTGLLPEDFPDRYFDIDAYVRDMKVNGTTITDSGHVFEPVY